MTDLSRQLLVMRRWIWLVMICVLVAAVGAYAYSMSQPKSYESTATLAVGQSLTSANPEYNQLLASQRLSQTYAVVATMGSTLERVIATLQLTVTPEELRSRVSTQAPADSTLITIRALDHDPAVAATIANAIAADLVAISPAIQGRETEVQQFIAKQLSSIQTQIQSWQDEIDVLTSVPRRTNAEEMRLQVLQDKLLQMRATYVAMLQSWSESSANLLTLADRAVPATSPASPKVMFNTILAGVFGLLVALGLIAIAERLDDTVKSPSDVGSIPTLAIIGRVDRDRRGSGAPATIASPRSPMAEAFRTLRTNLGFASVDGPLRAILVTSSIPAEGKTTVAANLAVVFAQAGRRVVLVDADLRRPGVHRLFSLPNNTGLSWLLRAETSDYMAVAQLVSSNLAIVTTGPLPPNPAELLASQRMKDLLAHMKSHADVVIIDSPPLHAVTDAAVLATEADGTLIVIAANSTKIGAVTSAVQSLTRVSARLLGVVLNRARDYAGGYYYYEYAVVAQAQSGPVGGADNWAYPGAAWSNSVPIGITGAARAVDGAAGYGVESAGAPQ